MSYLHYYFDNASIAEIKNYTIQGMLKAQIAKQQIRKNLMAANADMGIQEYETLMDFFTTDKNGMRKEIFQNEVSGYGTDVQGTEKSFASFGSMSPEGLANFLKDRGTKLADLVSLFVSSLESYLSSAYSELVKEGTFEDYQNAVIKEYISKKGEKGISLTPGSSELRQAIISDFLQHNGLNSLKINAGGKEGSFRSAVQNLTLLAEGIKEVGTSSLNGKSFKWSSGQGGKNNGVINNQLELFLKISAKVGGSFSNVKGFGAELAAAAATLDGINKVFDEIKIANKNIASMKDIKVIPGDKYITRRDGLRVSKGDVTVTIEPGGKVLIGYGISVKNYGKPNTSLKNIKHITLGTYNNFLSLGHQAGYDDNTLLHYAAAHSSRGVGAKKYTTGNTSDAMIEAGWKKIKEQVVYMNLLDALAGEGNEAEDTVMVLIINGTTLTVDEILQKMLNYEENNVTASTNSLSRGTYKAMNKWIKDSNHNGFQDEAASRGEAAWNSVHSALQSCKFRITLNNLAGLI